VVELDRLSLGSKDRHYDSPEHAEMLRTGAQKAVTFLENGFDARNSHLRALTSEGTTLDTITFRSEQLKDLVRCLLLFDWSLPTLLYWTLWAEGFPNPSTVCDPSH